MSAKRSIRITGKPILGKGSLAATIKYKPEALQIIETPFGVILDLEDAYMYGEPGAPGFPMQLIRLALPPQSDVTDIEATVVKKINVTDKPVFVAAVQEPRPVLPTGQSDKIPIRPSLFVKKKDTVEKPTYLERSLGVTLPYLKEYQRILASPPSVVQISTIEHFGVATILSLEVHPVQQNGNGFLELATEIKINLTYASTKIEEKVGPFVGSRFFKPLRSAFEAKRLTDILKGEIINPGWIIDIGNAFPPLVLHCDYLIITDNNQWDPVAIKSDKAVGDLVSAFTKLSNWKKRRGLQARIATINDIVDGKYGDFKTGARDLQEVLRNFLKWAYKHWGIDWVLLGGDANIIPVRLVASNCRGFIGVDTIHPPEDNQSYWNGTFLEMHVVNPGELWPGSTPLILTNPADGTVIPYDPVGTSNAVIPGWYYTTNNTYSTRTSTQTNFVRVNGPAMLINANLQWLYQWNTLSTDLYYSSLVGPNYDLPGVHDWDLLDNGVYGQHTASVDFDGVKYGADVGLGRAPVGSESEANAFVDKVIAYEQLRQPDGTSLNLNWARRLTLISTNYVIRIWINSTNANPPSDNSYHHEVANPYTLIKLKDVFSDLHWRLFVQVTSTDIRIIPYNWEASVAGRGWFFAKSNTDLTPSEHIIPIFGMVIHIPVPTNWIVVYGNSDELAPSCYIIDRAEADGSMNDQESVRKQIAADFTGINVVNRLYEDEVDLPPADAASPPVSHITSNRVRDALNLGPHFLCLGGHGSQGGCCYLGNSMADNATNGFHQPIVYAMSCLTSDFQVEDAMCEELLKNNKGGAVGYVGYTRFGWIGVGDDYEREFFNRLKTTRHLALLNDSRFNLPNNNGMYKWTKFVQILLGDPEMPVWVGKPKVMKVTHTAKILKADQNVVVEVKTSSNVAIKDAMVSFAMGNGWVVSETTNAAGQANLHINPPTTGTIEVVVTAVDYVPYFGTITVKEKVECKTAILCKLDILCNLNIMCPVNILCREPIACRAGIICRTAISCGLKISPKCPQNITCGLAISGCKAGIGPGCPAIDPEPFKDFVDIIKESGVKNIKELSEKQDTPKVKEVIAKLQPANRKALELMLKKIGKE
jgi:hypothetical protein